MPNRSHVVVCAAAAAASFSFFSLLLSANPPPPIDCVDLITVGRIHAIFPLCDPPPSRSVLPRVLSPLSCSVLKTFAKKKHK